jgi:hypothetical protein
MAKTSGLGFTIALDDASGSVQNISNDTSSLKFATPRAVYDWTGVDLYAIQRGIGLADCTVDLSGIFNPAVTTTSHAVLRTASSTSVVRTLTLTIAAAVLANEMIITDYQLSRDGDGNFTWEAPLVLASGLVPTWA